MMLAVGGIALLPVLSGPLNIRGLRLFFIDEKLRFFSHTPQDYLNNMKHLCLLNYAATRVFSGLS
jgi:hypothetical protein